jgi:hypothetical protein
LNFIKAPFLVLFLVTSLFSIQSITKIGYVDTLSSSCMRLDKPLQNRTVFAKNGTAIYEQDNLILHGESCKVSLLLETSTVLSLSNESHAWFLQKNGLLFKKGDLSLSTKEAFKVFLDAFSVVTLPNRDTSFTLSMTKQGIRIDVRKGIVTLYDFKNSTKFFQSDPKCAYNIKERAQKIVMRAGDHLIYRGDTIVKKCSEIPTVLQDIPESYTVIYDPKNPKKCVARSTLFANLEEEATVFSMEYGCKLEVPITTAYCFKLSEKRTLYAPYLHAKRLATFILEPQEKKRLSWAQFMCK